MCNAIGRPELTEEERYRTNDLRLQNIDALKAEIDKVVKTKTVAHWLKVMDEAGIPAGPINNVGQAIDSAQAKARNMVVTTDDAKAGTIRLVGNPIKLTAFADPTTRAPAPDLDADRERILRSL
jgi:CoA:oxalate CoA-transferase